MSHIHEKIDYAVEVFIVHKNKVLLRFHEKYHIWCSVGGHIELDEDPIEAVHREVKEEVGLDIEISSPKMPDFQDHLVPLIPPRFLARHKVNDNHEHIILIYFATSDTDVIKDAVYDIEKAETRWVTKEELDTMDLVPNIRFYAKEALKELSIL